jgi:hypothetical protein
VQLLRAHELVDFYLINCNLLNQTTRVWLELKVLQLCGNTNSNQKPQSTAAKIIAEFQSIIHLDK